MLLGTRAPAPQVFTGAPTRLVTVARRLKAIRAVRNWLQLTARLQPCSAGLCLQIMKTRPKKRSPSDRRHVGATYPPIFTEENPAPPQYEVLQVSQQCLALH